MAIWFQCVILGLAVLWSSSSNGQELLKLPSRKGDILEFFGLTLCFTRIANSGD